MRKLAIENEHSEVNQAMYKTMLKEGEDFLRSITTIINFRAVTAIFLMFHHRFKMIFDQISVSDTEIKQIQ